MKNIIITGASRGIGQATVLAFAKLGVSKLLLVARSKDGLNKIQQQIKQDYPIMDVMIFPFDLLTGNYALLKDFIDAHFEEIDILVNNAGTLSVKPFLQMNDEDFDSQFTVNVKSAFKLSQFCIPKMNRGGHIVNISSMGGIQGSIKFPGLSLYSASKGAISILTESLAAELVDQEISVNALAFGAVDTDMLRSAFPDYKASLSAEEMGAFLADFAWNQARYFNGKVLPVSSSTP
jgi:NAD(P)-dependent dehydrogenase (short-subunit alcohol dehydrogenase family)